MRIAIHQPSYWPWLGLMDKIASCDLFIVLDNVAISKGSFQYRNEFLCDGKMKFITLPVNFHNDTRLQDLAFSKVQWQEQQLSYLRNYYLKSAYFDEIYPLLEELYLSYDSTDACTFIFNTMKTSAKLFGLGAELKRAGEHPFTMKKGNLVLEICRHFKADTYFSGRGAQSYMDEALLSEFRSEGIAIEWQNFTHPVYHQGNSSAAFVEGLSCLDYLFHQGIEKAKKILNKTCHVS